MMMFKTPANFVDKTFPLTLRIAAITTSIDLVKKIEPVVYYIKPRHTVSVLKINNWEDRLVKKCAKVINNDIDKALKNNSDITFYVYCLGHSYTKNLFHACVDLQYDIE